MSIEAMKRVVEAFDALQPDHPARYANLQTNLLRTAIQQATQVEVTDHVIRKTYSDVMTALREENRHVIGGAVAIEIDMPVRFARAILALRPAAVPMTYEQIKTEFHRKQDELSEKGASDNCPTDLIDFTVGIRFAEAHHGITAQAKKETP